MIITNSDGYEIDIDKDSQYIEMYNDWGTCLSYKIDSIDQINQIIGTLMILRESFPKKFKEDSVSLRAMRKWAKEKDKENIVREHFIVTRKLTRVSEAVGEYDIHEEIVKEMLEEVLAMAEVDYMKLVASFIHNKTLFLIFDTISTMAFNVTKYEQKKLDQKFKEKPEKITYRGLKKWADKKSKENNETSKKQTRSTKRKSGKT